MDNRIIDLYNEYVHKALPRRTFLARLAQLTGSVAAASAVLPLLEPNYARARQVDEKDPRLSVGYVTYRGATGDVRAYRARPKGQGRLPAVLVIHENRGLNAHIEDVARRTALAGYLAVAPDGLTSAGGAPTDQEKARDLFTATPPEKIAGDLLAALPWLAKHPEATDKLGVVGFCYGGGMALRCAVTGQVDAAVCFYGPALPAEEVAKVKTPLLLHYAGNDERINAGIPQFRAALDAHGVPYSLNMYPGTQHGFHNDASEARYEAASARLAWERTLEFLEMYLKRSTTVSDGPRRSSTV